MIYDVGDVATITTELRDALGVLTDATVSIVVTKPDGTEQVPALIPAGNGGVGKFKALLPLPVAGTWSYVWAADDLALAFTDGSGALPVLGAGRLASAAAYIGASATDPMLAGIVLTAVTMVDEYLGPSGVTACPGPVRDLAVNQLASELFSRRNSPGGVVWAPGGDSVTRLSRDAMVSVAPLLRSYAEAGIA